MFADSSYPPSFNCFSCLQCFASKHHHQWKYMISDNIHLFKSIAVHVLWFKCNRNSCNKGLYEYHSKNLIQACPSVVCFRRSVMDESRAGLSSPHRKSLKLPQAAINCGWRDITDAHGCCYVIFDIKTPVQALSAHTPPAAQHKHNRKLTLLQERHKANWKAGRFTSQCCEYSFNNNIWSEYK